MIPRAAALLALFAFSATASAQVLGPIQYLPGDDVIAPAAFNQQAPHIARGGDQYLAVWIDYRTGGDHLILDEGGADVYAARLDADGNVLDTLPILISAEAGDQSQPEVAWNGTHWLVTWVTQKPTQFFWADAIRAVRVAPSGQVLDAQPIPVFDYSSSSGVDYAVASDGTNWAVAVRGTQGGDTDVKGIRIGPDGTVLNPGGTVLVTGDFTLTFNLNLVFAQDEYLLAYTHASGVKYRLFSTTLAPLTNVITITTSFSSLESPHAASNGTDFYVVWREYTSTTQIAEIKGTRISHAGVVLDPGGDRIFRGSGGGDVPRVAWDGTYWFVTFRARGIFDQGYYAARVSADGTVLDPDGVEVFDDHFAFDPEIDARPEGGVRVVYYDDPAGGPTPYDVFTRSIAPTFAATPPVLVPYSAPAQVQVDVATSGAGSMIAYRSDVSGLRSIQVHPLDADGNPLLAEPVTLASGPDLADPAVAWNGALYLVVWTDPAADGVVGRRVAADGTPVDAAPFFIMEGFGPDVAATGSTFLVVDIQITFTPEIQEPFAVRVDGPTGAVLGPPRDVGSNHTRHVSVTSTGTRWLVAFQRNFSHDDPNAEVRANFVEADGTAGPDFTVSGGLNPFNYGPEVAWNGTDGLVVFYDANASEDEVLGARVFDDRTVSPTFIVADAADEQNDPAVAWDGEQYVTLYEDLREVTFFLDERSDVYGTRLAADGTVIDASGFQVFSDPLSEVDPAVAGSGGAALLVVSDFRELPPYTSYRVAYRSLGQGATPAVTVSVEPVSPPVVVPAAGGSFPFALTLTNTTDAAQTVEFWTALAGPVAREPLLGPKALTLAPGATLTRTLTQRIPAGAPAGTYTYTGNVGTFGGAVLDSDSFPFTKEGAATATRVATSSSDWVVSGWEEAPSAEASGALPEGFALSSVSPNPFRSSARLALEVGVAQRVAVEVFDALGRRVALLHDGMMEAGVHALVLDGRPLPAGVYVVRVTGEASAATRRAVLVR